MAVRGDPYKIGADIGNSIAKMQYPKTFLSCIILFLILIIFYDFYRYILWNIHTLKIEIHRY